MSKPNKFKITAFRAYENVTKSFEYLNGHRNVLEEHGLTQITTANQSWISDKSVYCLILTDKFNNTLGGVRIHIKNEVTLLPLEESLISSGYDSELIRNSYYDFETCEICGLWNSKKISGMNYSVILAIAAYQVSLKLGINRLLMFNAKSTFRITINLGFQIIRELGDFGAINYPTPAFQSYVWTKQRKQSSMVTPYTKFFSELAFKREMRIQESYHSKDSILNVQSYA